MKELISIQNELKAPKNQFNSFGKYKYRSQEDILEAVKPLLAKYGCVLTIEDEVKQVGNYVFIEARATIQNSENKQWSVKAQAGVQERKGMDLAQSFGASSSYARKYALNGLFLIDDTKDADATNTHGKEEVKEESEITPYQKEELIRLLESSSYDVDQKAEARFRILNYTKLHEYEKAKTKLLQNQLGIDGVTNPSQKDINNHIKKFA